MADGATWDDKWLDDMTARANAELTNRLVGRLALNPVSPKIGAYGSTIDSFDFDTGTTGSLKLITISAVFHIDQGSLGHKEFVLMAAAHAAYQLASAEDAIVLLGDLGDMPKSVVTTPSNLKNEKDLRGLFDAAPSDIDGTVVDSILAGLAKLRAAGQHGPFTVILSPSLHQEASTPLSAAGGQMAIEPILPQLRDSKLLPPSDVLPGRSGVILSLGGATVEQVITYDAHVEILPSEPNAKTFVVKEQFRLRVNDPTAIATLE